MQPVHVGGSFAPPLDDAKLASYKAMAESLPPSPVRDGMLELHACVSHWWTLPDSKGQKTPHPSGMGAIVKLDAEHQQVLWESIPWEHELAGMAALFEGIHPISEKALRDAAHHLLWHVKELDLGREPITTDKL